LQSLLTPDQEKLQSQLNQAATQQGAGGAFGKSADYYRDLLSEDPQAMQEFQAPEMTRFNEEIIPGLSEQFAGIGGLSSSGFQNAGAQAGQSLSERLGALRAGLRSQGAQGLQNIGQFALQPRVENIHRPETSGLIQSAAQGVGQGLASYAGQKMTGQGGIGGNRGGGGNYSPQYSNQANTGYGLYQQSQSALR